MKSFLNYIGSKHRFFQRIEKYLPKEICNYYEPFVGGGSVLFNINNKYKIKKNYINDIDSELINIYKSIKKDVNKLLEYLEILDKFKSKQKFLQILNLYNNKTEIHKNKILKSAIYIYLNKKSYNGIFHYGKSGVVKPYYSAYKSKHIFRKENILKISELLKNTNIQNTSYELFINKNKIKQGDFVYLDPPYLVKQVKQYYKKSFEKKNYEELKTVCDKLNKNDVNFMLTLNGNLFLKKIFKEYNIHCYEKKSNISNFKYVKEHEMIITNYKN